MTEARIEHRISGADTGFIYVGDTRVGFCPVWAKDNDREKADNRLIVWLVNNWPSPTPYEFMLAVHKLRHEYPRPRGIVIDGEDGLIPVK